MSSYSPALELGLHTTPYDRGSDSPISPYGVAAKSVAPVQELPKTTPLVPFEQQALKYLLTQYESTSPRVKAEFIRQLDIV